MGDALIAFMGIAILVGAPIGLAMAFARWLRILVTSSVLLGAVILVATKPWGAWFFGLPLVTFAAVCASACVWARNSGPADVPDIVRWLAGTHVFWAAVSLINLKVLFALALPPLVLFAGEYIFKFLPFVLPPLACALAISVGAARLVYSHRPHLGSRSRPMVFNVLMLIAFLACAEGYKTVLMQTQLSDAQPECVASRSFLFALSNAGDRFRTSNGYFEKSGKRYHWSYSERRFVDAPGYALACSSRSQDR
jgi:hypothetical protein